MKKRILVLSVLASFTVTSFGCGKKEEETVRERTSTQTETRESVITTPDSVEVIEIEEEPDYGALYDEILKQDFEVLCDSEPDFDKYDNLGITGLIEASMYMEKGEAVSTIGYSVQDITGDGVPELIIAYIDNIEETAIGNDIINVYSVVDGKVVNLIEAWGRNSYRYMGEASFYNVGSGGAAYSMLAKYSITYDGAEVICDDCYFTSDEGSADFEISYYYNNTGEWDIANSEIVSEDDFLTFDNQCSDSSEFLELTPFSEYGDVSFSMDIPVIAGYSSDIMQDFDYVEAEYVYDDSEYQVPVTIYTTEDVTDLTFYSLLIQDYDDNGNPVYEIETLGTHGDLTEYTPVDVVISFPGDSPTFGLSFVDANGNERYFSICQSGYDNAIVVEEF